MVNSNFPTFPNFDFPAFWAENFFPNMPACRRAGPARKNDFQKFSSTMLVWYLFGKFRLNRAKWWRNYQNRTIFGRFMDVWSRLDVLMTSSGIIWHVRCCRRCRRQRLKSFFSDSFWLGDAPFQILALYLFSNGNKKQWVTLTPPRSSDSPNSPVSVGLIITNIQQLKWTKLKNS